MTSRELRQLYIDFFTARGHKQIPSASLIPENDPSVLFTTAGMHPLVPYLLGAPHPMGKRLVDFQKCLRTCDIDEVGDANHLTFFEMMGNWSLGDYWKKESLALSHEFLTKVLKIPMEKISVTCFAGDGDAPRDIEAADAWRELGYPDDRIRFLPKSDNWWGPAGITGPCGPDSEIFYDNGIETVEIWNNVFLQYNKDADGKFAPLAQKNVDTGLGLERTLAVITGKASVFDTEFFIPIIKKIEELTGKLYNNPESRIPNPESRIPIRIIADHLRASTFVLGDDKAVQPSNTDQGYVLRRLIRRAYRYLAQLGAPKNAMSEIAEVIIENYKDVYPELGRNRDFIIKQLNREEELFGRTLESGMKIAKKYIEANALSDENVFHLYDTYGFPLELTRELAAEHGIKIDRAGFDKLYAEHQEKSRAGAEQKFKGGLADNGVETTRLHTAAHLMHGALRRVLGDSVFQRGANITAERLRFDFSFDRKMTDEEIRKVEEIVNKAIAEKIPVVCENMSVKDAKASGAIGIFDDKYGAVVKVYSIEGYSKEICGGPHAENTGDLGTFKILKEESSAAGVRRIKAVIGA
ncbi:MAG: alanine--tRNA ligase [Rickettsiales bacterium]|jgi:alanyl-tRNA synthetase|nr:alanine--tRNA ligase [Rickettsiales bacterium]